MKKSTLASNVLGLPSADNFVAYLLSVVSGNVTVEGPVVTDWSYGMDYCKQWTIRLDGQVLGVFSTFGPKPGEKMGMQYVGRIPGYVNEAIAICNEGHETDGQMLPVDRAILIFDNHRFEAYAFHEGRGSGSIVETPWQRQDGNKEIPFP
jgi:hypothetical protein